MLLGKIGVSVHGARPWSEMPQLSSLRKKVLTQRVHILITLLHHVPGEDSLIRILVTPLLLGDVHGHILYAFRQLK